MVFYPSNLKHYQHLKYSHIQAKCTFDITSFSCSCKAHCKINYITQALKFKWTNLSTKENNSVNREEIRDTFCYKQQGLGILLCTFCKFQLSSFCQISIAAVLITISTIGTLPEHHCTRLLFILETYILTTLYWAITRYFVVMNRHNRKHTLMRSCLLIPLGLHIYQLHKFQAISFPICNPKCQFLRSLYYQLCHLFTS